MWELDYKEIWVPKNWCFWTVVLEKTLESPLACKEIQPVHPKENQSWVFIWRTDAEAETPILWPLMRRTDSLEKTLMLGKIEGRRKGGWQRMRWLNGHEFEQAPRVADGQGSLAFCSAWGHKESDTTDWLNWTDASEGLSRWCSGKESTWQYRRWRFDPWVRKIPWRRKWQLTPVFLPGKFRVQRSLAGCSPRSQRFRQDWESKPTYLSFRFWHIGNTQ